MTYYYGVNSLDHIKTLARQVCALLGGDRSVQRMLIETTCPETHGGTYPDAHPDTKGVGLCQHDQINIDDLKLNGEARHFSAIKRTFGYDIMAIELADLAEDPLLSLICCRLSYKRIPAKVPATLIEIAIYWKRYYNTEAGKGTIDHYLEAVEEVLGSDWS